MWGRLTCSVIIKADDDDDNDDDDDDDDYTNSHFPTFMFSSQKTKNWEKSRKSTKSEQVNDSFPLF